MHVCSNEQILQKQNFINVFLLWRNQFITCTCDNFYKNHHKKQNSSSKILHQTKLSLKIHHQTRLFVKQIHHQTGLRVQHTSSNKTHHAASIINPNPSSVQPKIHHQTKPSKITSLSKTHNQRSEGHKTDHERCIIKQSPIVKDPPSNKTHRP